MIKLQKLEHKRACNVCTKDAEVAIVITKVIEKDWEMSSVAFCADCSTSLLALLKKDLVSTLKREPK